MWHVLGLCWVAASWGHQLEGQACNEIERLDRLHCYGLKSKGAPDESSCSNACCDDPDCEVWQFHEKLGCFFGLSQVCLRSNSDFGRASRGARIRSSRSGEAAVGADMNAEVVVSAGKKNIFSAIASVEPYIDGPDTEKYESFDGDIYLVRRYGPQLHQLDVSTTCWSVDRLPQHCCAPELGGFRDCWASAAARKKCCEQGTSFSSENLDGEVSMYNVYVMISAGMSRDALQRWDALFPKLTIDETAFEKKRMRWRLGHEEPGEVCPAQFVSGDGYLHASDGSTVIWPMMRMFSILGIELSGTFVNIGAGTCDFPDPLHQLIFSEAGRDFAGLAVEANFEDLQRCNNVTWNATSRVIPVHAGVDPLTVNEKLMPYLNMLFQTKILPTSAPLPLDILVVDIDGSDCHVAEELLQLVRPKVLVVEIMFFIPPPFRYASHHDVFNSEKWLNAYDVNKLMPSAGCSLSFAIHRFQPFGYHLFRLTAMDAVFVHDSVAWAIEKGFKMKLPQDEFLCYRRSRLWMQMQVSHVREWFFASHPADSFSHIWHNLSLINRELGRPGAPFAFDY